MQTKVGRDRCRRLIESFILRTLVACVCLATVFPAAAQTNGTYKLSSEALEEGTLAYLVTGWRYHPGDDQTWADAVRRRRLGDD